VISLVCVGGVSCSSSSVMRPMSPMPPQNRRASWLSRLLFLMLPWWSTHVMLMRVSHSCSGGNGSGLQGLVCQFEKFAGPMSAYSCRGEDALQWHGHAVFGVSV
jgi:hypothetical protein